MGAMSTEKHLLNPSVRSRVIFWTEDVCIDRERERLPYIDVDVGMHIPSGKLT